MRESSTLTANAVPQAKGWVRYSSVSGSSSSSFIMHIVIKPFIVYNVHRLNILNCTYWYRCKNQFQNPSGVWQFCGYQYFSFEILFNLIYSYSPFFRISLITMLRPQKGNSGVSSNDTLLNFGLWIIIIILYSVLGQTLYSLH